jgi:LuxR family transcriptional regulator, maltose regulon positive regulatory protein
LTSISAVDRFQPPLYRVELLPRTELRRRLDRALSYPLTVIAAPAGYGKTSLLSQWRFDQLSRGIDVAWLSIVEAGIEPHALATDLVLTIANAGRNLGQLTALAEDGLSDMSTQSVVVRLGEALGQDAGTLILIIDDVHRISAAAFSQVLEQLLLRAPPDLVRIVLSGRDSPPINIPELEGRGLLLRLDPVELRFSANEAREVLAGIASEQIERFVEQAEGWPIVLQLLRSWLRTRPESTSSQAALPGGFDGIVSYLTDQVLSNLAEDAASLLCDVSILDAFNPDLVAAVTGISTAWREVIASRLLEYLIVPLDAHRYWFRYHHLIDEILRQRLQRQPVEYVAQLHRRASRWFEEHGMPVEAVRHACGAGDFDRAARMIERMGVWEMTQFGGVSLLRRLLAPIPPERAREYPRLQLGRAYLLAKSSKTREALQLFKATEEATAGFSRVAGDEIGPTRRDAAIVSRMVAGYCDLPLTSADLDGVRRSLEELPASDGVARAILLNVAAVYAHSLGCVPTALELANQAVRAMQHVGSVVGLNYCSLYVGLAHLGLGHRREAEAVFQEASALAEENFGADSGLRARADVLLSVALYSRGDIVGARERLGPALRQAEAGDGSIGVYFEGYETAAAIALIDGDNQALDDILRRMEHTASERGLGRLAALRETLIARITILRGDFTAAEEALARISPPFRPGAWRTDPYWWRVHDEAALAAAMLALAREDLPGAEIILDDLASAATAGSRELPLALTQALRAVLWLRRGDAAGASRMLFGVVEKRMAEDDLQCLARLGPVIAPLVRTARARASESTASVRIRNALTDLKSAVDQFRVGGRGTSLPLSPREMEVLAALARGAPNKAIARALQMTENTVKFHLKSVFQKLGVSSREAAIEVARRHEL